MKKVIFISIVVILTSFLFSSCTNQPVQTPKEKTVKTITVTEELDTQGFLLSKEIVSKGQTVWGFSQKAYGTGMRWREIVSQNPFLQQPGRVYYDDGRKMWIVRIYPGETLNIGGTSVVPIYSYTSEEIISEEITPATQESLTVPWWGWLLIVSGILFFVWLFWFYRNGNGATAFSNSSSNVSINLVHDFDRDTRAALLRREQDRLEREQDLLERQQDRFDRIIDIFHRDSKKNRIKSFVYEEGDVFAGADYRNTKKDKKVKKENKKEKTEEKPGDQK